MGIYMGKTDRRGRPMGIQMGNSGAKVGHWGPGGWLDGTEPSYYRPKKVAK